MEGDKKYVECGPREATRISRKCLDEDVAESYAKDLKRRIQANGVDLSIEGDVIHASSQNGQPLFENLSAFNVLVPRNGSVVFEMEDKADVEEVAAETADAAVEDVAE